MDYINLIQIIKERGFKKILVTGPHRSGTTFAAACIANDLEINFYPEENIRGGSLALFAAFNKTHEKYVLQAPGLSVNCDKVDVDVVIFMNRNLPDIIDGMRILNSTVIQFELSRIDEMFGKKYTELGLPLAKLTIFNKIQKQNIENSFLLNYESLNKHKLWIPETERKDWSIRQITTKTTL